MHWILGIALTVAVFINLKQWGALSADKKKAAAWKIVLVVGAAVLLFLVLTGRVHIITAGIAALIPLLRKLPALLRFLPFIRRMSQGSQQQGQNAGGESAGRSASTGGMDLSEACDTLGVAANASREEIVNAHRRLIQKLHPDRGGNDYLAAKINEAKSVLLKHCAPDQ